ncbi:MAG: hypothetical protein H0W83_14225, partial [Planctomycetes bacterium]|nr:hypothetical protein [Planctomycetota bacterium]
MSPSRSISVSAVAVVLVMVQGGCGRATPPVASMPAKEPTGASDHWPTSNPNAHANAGFLADWGKDVVELPLIVKRWGAVEYLEVGAIAGAGLFLYS